MIYLGIKGFVIDLDGTLYRGDSPITGASEFMNWLQKKQRSFVLATNCPSRTPEQIVEKLDRLGIKTRTNQILTSGISAARYLYSHGFRRVFLVGESAAQQALEQHGIIVTQQRPQCVLVAWDRSFSYSTLNCTLRFLMEGLPLFCTNSDATIPDGDTYVAHTGAICASVETASGKKAICLGKPHSEMAKSAIQMLGVAAQEICVIGDSMDIDIRFARQNNMKSVLSLTGRPQNLLTNHPDRTVRTLDELIDKI